MKSLIWKEWHEQRWKLALGLVIVAGFTAVGLRSRLLQDATIVLIAGLLGGLVMPVLIGMGVIATERAEGSLSTLLALPVRPGRVLLAKLLAAGAACVAPVAAAAAVAYLIAADRELTVAQLLGMHLLSTAAALMMLLWTVTLSVRQPSEARAALLALGFLLLGLMPHLFAELTRMQGEIGMALAAHPIGLVLGPRLGPADLQWLIIPGVMAVNGLVAAILLPLTAALFARSGALR